MTGCFPSRLSDAMFTGTMRRRTLMRQPSTAINTNMVEEEEEILHPALLILRYALTDQNTWQNARYRMVKYGVRMVNVRYRQS